jgi:hypothetical protein
MVLTTAHGDSGSWIVEQDSGRLCGHIVAADLSTGLAYVIPAKAVFEQIERQLDCRIELAESDNLHSELLSAVFSPPYSSASATEVATEKGKEKDDQLPAATPKESEPGLSSTAVHPASIPAAMETGSWRETVSESSTNNSRDRERHRAQRSSTSTRTNEYFVPRDGIDREVITADITRYLGNDALVRPGQYEVYLLRSTHSTTILTLSLRIPRPDRSSKDISSRLTEILPQ